MELYELEEPTTATEREHDEQHEPSAVACVIATSHIAIAVGDLIYAAKLLGRREGFDGLHTLEQAQEHLGNAVAQLSGRVWDITVTQEPAERANASEGLAVSGEW